MVVTPTSKVARRLHMHGGGMRASAGNTTFRQPAWLGLAAISYGGRRGVHLILLTGMPDICAASTAEVA
ncbi:MAG: hypothetical protein M5U29_03130 [Anaerolineae bacterium]|nr:hypothetical protein [Anaerolineae bacterium]